MLEKAQGNLLLSAGGPAADVMVVGIIGSTRNDGAQTSARHFPAVHIGCTYG
jgi:hypothetical protein